jgi:hypothetical protein
MNELAQRNLARIAWQRMMERRIQQQFGLTSRQRQLLLKSVNELPLNGFLVGSFSETDDPDIPVLVQRGFLEVSVPFMDMQVNWITVSGRQLLAQILTFEAEEAGRSLP